MMADDLTNFLKFEGTEFQKFILPIIPGGAVLSPSSKIVAGQLGKIPGKLTDDGWAGFANWPANRTKPTQLLRWQEWQEQGKLVIPAGLSLALYHALDIDCDDFTIAMCLEGIAREHLGITPVVRCRHGSPRRVLIYRHEDHTAPITKQSWSFEDTEQKRHLAEFLATGQFVVIEGPHAKLQGSASAI